VVYGQYEFLVKSFERKLMYIREVHFALTVIFP